MSVLKKPLVYEELMRESCGSGKAKAVCCPVNSQESGLSATMGAEAHEFPHQARFKIGRGLCGSTIYNDRYILTAAHCLYDKTRGYAAVDESDMKIYVGSNFGSLDEAEDYYQVEQAIPHPKYVADSGDSSFDIALLKLAKPLKFGENVKALRVAPEGFTPISKRKYLDKRKELAFCCKIIY